MLFLRKYNTQLGINVLSAKKARIKLPALKRLNMVSIISLATKNKIGRIIAAPIPFVSVKYCVNVIWVDRKTSIRYGQIDAILPNGLLTRWGYGSCTGKHMKYSLYITHSKLMAAEGPITLKSLTIFIKGK